MATRLNTIEYVFPQYEASLASATRYDFAALTIYIPEAASRSFKSVILEVACLDNVTVAANLTAQLLGIKLGAAAFDDNTVFASLTNSGEQQSWLFTRDCTAYFNTNFGAGASQTCQIGVMFTGPITINHTARLIITYSYDDSSQDVRIKTVRIPLDSGLGALTAALAEIGTNQVPNLDNLLPEASKTIRDIFFIIEGNEDANGTVDFNHCVSLDAEAEDQDGLHEQGMNSARWFRRIWKRTDMATNAVHAFKMRVTSITGGECRHLAIVLYVTYEYNHTNSTTILNSLALPFVLSRAAVGGNAAGDQEKEQIKFFIEEPTTITLVQSGIQLWMQIDSASNLSLACGAQAVRAYTELGTLYCGCVSLTHRIDSGGAAGAGITLARGEVTFTALCYDSAAASIRHGSVDGLLYLNYTSGKAAGGAMTHNRTIVWGSHFKNANLYSVQLATVALDIPEVDFYLNSIGIRAYLWRNNAAVHSLYSVMEACAERAAGEGPASGWQSFGEQSAITDNENGVDVFVFDATPFFDHHPNDPRPNLLGIETSRSFALKSCKNPMQGAIYFTYYAITRTVSGTVSGYTGDGSGLTVNVYRDDIKEWVLSLTTAAGGSFSGTWYDDTVNLYADCRQDATHIGRSERGVGT